MTNLISGDHQWSTVNLPQSTSLWRRTSEGYRQYRTSKSKKVPSGTMRLTGLPLDTNTIRLLFEPGSVYYSGLVVNFKNEENFILIVINKFSARLEGYQIDVGEVVEGKYLSKCREKYTGRLKKTVELLLCQTGGGFSLRLNGETVFNWRGMRLIADYKIGLYTQQNDDTLFTNLSVSSEKKSSSDKGSTTPPQEEREVPVTPFQEKMLLKKGQGKQHVSFTVFQPLDQDLNDTIYDLIYPPKVFSKIPIGLPEHQHNVGVNGTESGQFNEIAGMTTDEANNLYVVDTLNQRIQVFDQSDNHIGNIGGNTPFESPVDLIVNADNSISVLDTSLNSIVNFDAKGRAISSYPLPLNSYPNHILKLTDESILIASEQNKLIKISEDGNVLDIWGNIGNGKVQFNEIKGIAISNENETIAIAEKRNKRVQLLNLDGSFKKMIGGNSFGIKYPYQLEVDTDGNIILGTGSFNDEIVVLSKDGIGISKWKENFKYASQGSIATDTYGNLYMANSSGGKIIKYSSEYVREGDWKINNLPRVFNPSSICIDKDNHTLWGISNFTLFSIDLKTGEYVEKNKKINFKGWAPRTIEVLTKHETTVLIAEPSYQYSQVQRYDANGKYLGNVGKDFPFGSGYYQIAPPVNTFNEWILIHDSSAFDFVCFDKELNYQGYLSEHIPSPGRIGSPHIFSSTPDGGYLINRDYRLYKYDKEGDEVTDYGDWSDLKGNIRGNFHFLSYDQDGNLYAIVQNNIVKLNPEGVEDKVWRESINIMDVGNGEAYRFTDLKFLCIDTENTLYAFGSTYDNGPTVLKINVKTNEITYLKLDDEINVNTLKCMHVDLANNLYLCQLQGSQFRFFKLNSDLIRNDEWGDIMASLIKPNYSIRDIRFELDNHISILVYDSKSQNQILMRIGLDGNLVDQVGGRQTFNSRSVMRTRSDGEGGVWVYDQFNNMGKGQHRLLHFSPANWKEADDIIDKEKLPILGEKFPEDFFYDTKNKRFLFLEMIKGVTKLIWYSENAVYDDDIDAFSREEIPGKNYFGSPLAICFGTSHNLWVVDDTGGEKVVHKLNATDYRKEKSIELPPQTNFDLRIAYHKGLLYLTDLKSSKLYSLNENNLNWQDLFVQQINGAMPAGMVFRDDHLFIALKNQEQVSKIKISTGKNLLHFTGNSPFSAPDKLAMLNNDLYLTNLTDKKDEKNIVFRLTKSGRISWKSSFTDRPKSISVHTEMGICVLAEDEKGVSSKLLFLSKENGEVTHEILLDKERFDTAWTNCIAFTAEGTLLIGGVGLIVNFKINEGKTALTERWSFERYPVSPDKPVTNRVNHVSDIGIDLDGYIYYTEHTNGGGTFILNQSGEYMTRFGNWSSEIEKTPNADHIAIAPNGTIYLSQNEKSYYKKYSPWTGQPVPELLEKQEVHIIDNRPRFLLSEFKQLKEQYDLVKNHFQVIDQKYKSLTINEITPDLLDDIEANHRKAFNALKEAEETLSAAKEQFVFLGLDYHAANDFLIEQLKQTAKQEELKLNEIKAQIRQVGSKLELRTYHQSAEGYIDQFGIHLFDYMSDMEKSPEDEKERWLVLPVGDIPDTEMSEWIYFIRYPKFSGEKIHPPSFHFEEKFSLGSYWKGAGLGEFANAINLTPGESKELIITTEKKIAWEETNSRKTSRSRNNSKEQENKTNKKDDFQSTLKNSLVNKSLVNKSEKVTDTKDHSSKVKVGAKVTLPFTKISLGGGISSAHTNKNKRINKSSKSLTLNDVSKRVKDTIRKTSQEVSNRNKLSFSNLTEEEVEEKRKETEEILDTGTRKIKVENINEGKTVNYLFFQVTNRYATHLTLENVQLHVSTGIELIKDTGITLDRMLPTLNFDELLFDKGIYTTPEREAIIVAIGTAILRRYLYHPEIKDHHPRIIKIAEHTLNKSSFNLDALKQLIHQSLHPPKLPEELEIFNAKVLEFAKLDMVIAPMDRGPQEETTVNSGHFYVDAQVGLNPATEEYLEDRRRIETEMHQALLEQEIAQTQAGIFYPKLPKGITHLTTEKK